MPAIAPIEDLKAAQKELLEVEDVEELKRYSRNVAILAGKMSASCGFRNAPQNN